MSYFQALKVRFASNCETVEEARILSPKEKRRKIERRSRKSTI